MTVNDRADAKPLAGTVFSPRQVRLLKLAVIAMGLVLIGGLFALVSVIVYQATQLGTTGAPSEVEAVGAALKPQAELPLPAGAEVTRLALDGDRLAVYVTAPGGPEIVVLDLISGEVLSRVRLRAQ